jgi:hypothetical protein
MGKSNRHDSAPLGDPGTWPDWTDDDRWKLGPDRSESEQDDGRDVHLSVDDWPGLDPDHGACREDQGVRHTADSTDVDLDQPTDAQIDLLAGEAEAQDRLERALCF